MPPLRARPSVIRAYTGARISDILYFDHSKWPVMVTVRLDSMHYYAHVDIPLHTITIGDK